MQVNVVDTVGCGDSFAAAIVLGYLQGQGLVSTLQLANAVGAATAMGRGAGRNVAGADTVLRLLETQLQGREQLAGSIPIDMLRTSLTD
jgi:sugar/nucleoside kinase (ribokinase family)